MLKYLNKTKDKKLAISKPKKTGTYLYSKIEYKYNQYIERIYALKYTLSKGIQYQEVLVITEKGKVYGKNCYYESYGQYSGFHVYFNKKYRNSYNALKYTEELEKFANWFPVEKVNREELIDLDELIKLDPSIKYCAYEANGYIRFIDYIKLYRKYPIAEMCMKLKLYRLCTEKALKKLTEDKAFAKWVFKNKDRLLYMSFQHTLGAYNKHQEPIDYYNSLQYRINCGKEISCQVKEIFNYTTQEKVYDYIKTNNINKSSYNDYIIACKYLKLDFADTKVLFPHNFKEMHDLYIKQYAEYLKEKRKEKYAGISKKMLKCAKKYSWLKFNDNNYSILIAENKEQLIDEGATLHHCVGRMDYDERQANEESIICFLRKNNSINTPFGTIELSLKNFKIKQCYGDNDNIINGIDAFKESWLDYIKTTRKKLQLV